MSVSAVAPSTLEQALFRQLLSAVQSNSNPSSPSAETVTETASHTSQAHWPGSRAGASAVLALVASFLANAAIAAQFADEYATQKLHVRLL